MKKRWFDLLIFLFLTIFTRIIFFKDFFHEFDPINFALAIRNFNIYSDQPHPPGYPIPVLISKIIYFFTKNELLSLQLMSLIFSIFTVWLFYLFILEIVNNRKFSVIFTIMFIFSGVFWFYGTVVDIYIFEAFNLLLLSYLGFLTFKNKKLIYFYSSIYGLIGGIRFNDLLFFFLLYIYLLIKAKIDFKRLILNFSILIFSILTWYIPNIISEGGLKIFQIHSKILFTWVLRTSIMVDFEYWNKLSYNTLIVFLKEASFIIIFLILIFILNKRLNLIKYSLIITIPSFLFYLFIHAPKVGYYLTIIPILYLILTANLYDLKIKYKNLIILSCLFIILLNSFLIFKNLQDVLSKEINYLKNYTEILKKSTNNNSLIILNENVVNLYRHTVWYLSNVDVYYLSNTGTWLVEWGIESGYIKQRNKEPIEIIKDNTIYLPYDTNNIIIVSKSPYDILDILELENLKIIKKRGDLFGNSILIVKYDIPKDFDYIFLNGFIIKKANFIN